VISSWPKTRRCLRERLKMLGKKFPPLFLVNVAMNRSSFYR
jgi:hypothetical protein